MKSETKIEKQWNKLVEKGCEHEYRPQQDTCFCKLNPGFICWWENCPRVNKNYISDIRIEIEYVFEN